MKKLLLLSFLCAHGMSLAMNVNEVPGKTRIKTKTKINFPATECGGSIETEIETPVIKVPAIFRARNVSSGNGITLASKILCEKLENNGFLQVPEATAVINFKMIASVCAGRVLDAINENDPEFRACCQPDEDGLFSQYEILFGENNGIICDNFQPVEISSLSTQEPVKKYGAPCINKGVLQVKTLYVLMAAGEKASNHTL